jgi:hypothetical protein
MAAKVPLILLCIVLWLQCSTVLSYQFQTIKFKSTVTPSTFSIKDSLSSNESPIGPKAARLNAMAAKLRAEAAELEAEQQKLLVESLTQLFNAFDTNKDGKISVEELKSGLSKALRETISEELAVKIMQQFDTSGDGALQLEEFRGIDTFRSKLDKILQDEKKNAQEAQIAANNAKAAARRAEEIAALINNKPPSPGDKLVSILPFLLPFLDSLPYGLNFIVGSHLDTNPFVAVLGFLYILYQRVPFSGLIAFFLFNIFSSNLQLNRLVRYNIQLAIYLDIALILPGIVGSLSEAIAKAMQFSVPTEVAEVASTATFLLFSSIIAYAIISSIIGKEADKIPFITDRIKERVPTTEEFQRMYDDFEKMSQKQLEQQQQKEKEKGKNDDDESKM